MEAFSFIGNVFFSSYLELDFKRTGAISTHYIKKAQFTYRWLSPEERYKGKDIPVTGRGGSYVCERSRFPHY
jgi:hypothetical protein